MPTAPTPVAISVVTGTGNTHTTPSLTVQSGDVVHVLALGEGSAAGNTFASCTTTLTNGGVTQLQLHAANSDCQGGAWCFDITGSGSGTVTVTSSAGVVGNAMVEVLVHRNAVKATVARSTLQASATRTVAYTPSQADSAIGWAVGDWAAAAVVTETPTSSTHTSGSPGPSAIPQSAAVGTNYTYYAELLDDQISTGSTSYGITGSGTGPFTILVVEIQGTGTTAAVDAGPGSGVLRPGFMTGDDFPAFMDGPNASGWSPVDQAYDLGAPAGVANTQPLTAGLGFTGADNQRVGSGQRAGVGFTAADSQAIAKGLTAAVSFTGSVGKSLARALVATLSFTGNLTSAAVHHFTQALTAALSFTGAQARRVGAGQTASVGFTGAQVRRVAKIQTATVSFTGALARRTATARTAAVGFTGTMARSTIRAMVATVSFTGSVASAAVHHFLSSLTATLGFTGSQAKATSSQRTASVGFTGAITRRVSKGLTAAVSFTGAQARAVRTGLTATVSFTGSVAKRGTRIFTATVSFTGSVTTAAVHFFTQALTATVGFTTAQSKRAGKSLAATLGFTGAQSRRTGKTQAASIGFTGAQPRRVTKAQTATVSFTGTMTKRLARALVATVSFTGTLATQSLHIFTKMLTATVGFTGATTRRTTRTLTAAVGLGGNFAKRTAPALRAGLGFAGSLGRGIGTRLRAALSFVGLLQPQSHVLPPAAEPQARIGRNTDTAEIAHNGYRAVQAMNRATAAVAANTIRGVAMDKYVAGDTSPDWFCRLFDEATGLPYDATTATSVTVKMWQDGVQIISRAGVPHPDGTVTLPLTGSDFVNPGPVKSRVIVVSGGKTQTFPPEGFMTTLIAKATP